MRVRELCALPILFALGCSGNGDDASVADTSAGDVSVDAGVDVRPVDSALDSALDSARDATTDTADSFVDAAGEVIDAGDAVAIDGDADVGSDADTSSDVGPPCTFPPATGDAGYATSAWSQRLGGTDKTSTVEIGDMAGDAAGHLYVVGTFGGTVDLGGGPITASGARDLFLAEYAGTGALMWAHSYGGSSGATLSLATLALDPGGDVVVSAEYAGDGVSMGGSTFPSKILSQGLIARYTSSGTHLWSKTFSAPEWSSIYPVAIAPSGNIVFAGSAYGSIDYGGGPLTVTGTTKRLTLVELTSGGAHVWSKAFAPTCGFLIDDVAIEPGGGVYTIGTFYGAHCDLGAGELTSTSAGYTGFLARYSAAGDVLWTKTFPDPVGVSLAQLVIDPSGDLFVDGAVQKRLALDGCWLGTAGGFDDGFVARLSPDGAVRWARAIGGPDEDSSYDMVSDGKGGVFAGGGFKMKMDVEPGGPTFVAGDPTKVVASWLVHLGGDGAYLGGRPMVDTLPNTFGLGALAVRSTGALVVAGPFQGTLDLAGAHLVTPGLSSADGKAAFLVELVP